jgi:hypothetical protein
MSLLAATTTTVVKNTATHRKARLRDEGDHAIHAAAMAAQGTNTAISPKWVMKSHILWDALEVPGKILKRRFLL